MYVPVERIAEVPTHVNKSAVHAIPTNLAVSLFTNYSGTPVGISVNTVCIPLGSARFEITRFFNDFSLYYYYYYYVFF